MFTRVPKLAPLIKRELKINRIDEIDVTPCRRRIVAALQRQCGRTPAVHEKDNQIVAARYCVAMKISS